MDDVHDDPHHPVHAKRRAIAATLLEQHDFGPGMTIPLIPVMPWNDATPNRLECRIDFDLPGERRLPCTFVVGFNDQTASIASVECMSRPEGHRLGKNPYSTGRAFNMRSGPYIHELSWSWLLRSLYEEASKNVQPMDEIGNDALVLVDAFGSAYSHALDDELPGQPFAHSTEFAMLHDGPDTALGRALFNLMERSKDRTGFLQHAVATLWVSHGAAIEENCDMDALVDPSPTP